MSSVSQIGSVASQKSKTFKIYTVSVEKKYSISRISTVLSFRQHHYCYGLNRCNSKVVCILDNVTRIRTSFSQLGDLTNQKAYIKAKILYFLIQSLIGSSYDTFIFHQRVQY